MMVSLIFGCYELYLLAWYKKSILDKHQKTKVTTHLKHGSVISAAMPICRANDCLINLIGGIMPKLFAVMLGGRAEGCHIELHDVVFVAADSLEQAYPKLVNKWFGSKEKIHIDSSIELSHVDGHEIILLDKNSAVESDKKLFFINFGAYRKNYFGEIHEVGFYVASSIEEAVERGKKELCLNLLQQHCDDKSLVTEALNDVESLLDDITQVAMVDQYVIDLKPTTQPTQLAIESYYRKLNLPHILREAELVSGV